MIQLGVTGSIAELNEVADFIAKWTGYHVLGIDEFGGDDSILSGPHVTVLKHKTTPPSMHSFVKLMSEVPDMEVPIAYIYVANDEWQKLSHVKQNIVKDTIIIARLEVLYAMVEEWGIEMLPTFYCQDWVAVKVC